MTEAETIRNRVRGCLVGLAVGDALGAPYEILTWEEIAYSVNDPDGVTSFIRHPAGCSDQIKRRLSGRPIGAITDDTQLSEASLVSLLRCDGYDREDQVRQFVEEYRRSRHGWGGTTKLAAQAYADWLYGEPVDGERPGRRPLTDTPPPTEPGKSCGNGVAMKIAPIALYHALIYPDGIAEFFENVRSIGLMTHGDHRAWIAAMGVALAIIEPFARGTLRDDGFGLAELTRSIICNSHGMEMRSGVTEDTFSERFQNALMAANNAETLREIAGVSCYSLESVPFSICTFLRHPNDYRTAVLEAVNAGGDTDTNAAMVGAMVGANMGEGNIPASWIRAVPHTKRMAELADQMFQKFWLGPRTN